MSYNYFVSSSAGNLIQKMFGSSTSYGADKGSSEILGMDTSVVGNYAKIQNGSYKKLMTAYYASQKDTSATSSSSKTTSSTTTAVLSDARASSKLVEASLSKLGKSTLYDSTGTDAMGKPQYNKEGIASAVKTFVENYNSYISSTGKTGNDSILSQVTKVQQATSSNAKSLSAIGITIGTDGKLVLDQNKLAAADVSSLKALFQGDSSYANKLKSYAQETYSTANSAIYASLGTSSYSSTGAYASLGSGNSNINSYL